MIFPSMAMNKNSALVFIRTLVFLAARLSIIDFSVLLDLIFFVSLSTMRKFLVLLALSYLIILFQVIPD